MRNLPDIIPDPVCASAIGTGWWPIVEKLHMDIIEIDANYIVDQVKEKFGGLRYYVTTSDSLSEDDNDEIHALIYKAERKCNRTCEWCGKPGHIHPIPKDKKYRWILTLCDECEKKRDEGFKPEDEKCECGESQWKHDISDKPIKCKEFKGTGEV